MAPTVDISRAELTTCIIIWCSAVFYSIYCFAFNSSKHFRFYEDVYSDFDEGWSFLSRKKDIGDDEWRSFKFIIKKSSLWVISLIAVSEILRTFRLIQILHLWRILIAALFLLTELGFSVFIMLILQPILFTFVLRFHNKWLIWLCNIFVLSAIVTYSRFAPMEEFISTLKLDARNAYFTMIGLCWMNLRSVSYCLDFVDSKRNKQELIKFFSYCLYLPQLLCGPFICYEDFIRRAGDAGDFGRRFFTLFKDVLRFLFWFFFIDLCLHFIYVNAIAYHPEWVKSFDSWSLYGYGYTMGQYFHMKYLVLYGLTTSFSRFENIKVPSLPVCIGRIHLYSDMWKYFDAGIYKFLIRYIYLPVMESGFVKSRLVSSLICFFFVFVWHGVQYYILIWSFLNYLGIALEYFAKRLYYKYLEHSKSVEELGSTWLRRLTCLAASPLLAMSAVSNFYFFAGAEIGYIFVCRILKDVVYSCLILCPILYTCCQISTEIKTRLKSKQTTKEHGKSG